MSGRSAQFWAKVMCRTSISKNQKIRSIILYYAYDHLLRPFRRPPTLGSCIRIFVRAAIGNAVGGLAAAHGVGK